ncbi:TonB-dependent receptor [candidate division KSB1 bacterium]|nr:TonB-dependent receptor [candidate division KSB1 bacterium]
MFLKSGVNRSIKFLILLFLTKASLWSAPNSTIKGCVSNENGERLSFANIFLKGKFDGCMSNENGFFQFITKETGENILVCSFIGYRTYEQKLLLERGESYELSIQLKAAPVQGERVTVTASAFTSGTEEGVTLSSLDVITTPGAAADVFWAMKTFPSVQQVDEGAGLFIRGGDVSETAIYLDGALLNHPYRYESPTGGFFGTISPFLLKGTFFSSGGFSAQYGNALSGVLDMESQDIPSQRSLNLGVGLAAHSLKVELPLLNQKLGISFSGNKSQTETMFKFNGNSKNFSHFPSAFDINLNAIWRYHSNGYLKFFIFRESDEVGIQVEDPIYEIYYRGETNTNLYNIRLHQALNKQLIITGNIAYSTFNRTMGFSNMRLNLDDNLWQFNFITEYEMLSSLKLRGGVNYLITNALFTGERPFDEENYAPEAQLYDIKTDYHSQRQAAFLEGEIITPWAMVISPGLRLEKESVSQNMMLAPRVNFTFPLTPSFSLTAAYGIYHQFPEIQYYDTIIGNPDLSPMKSIHSIVGMHYQHETTVYRCEIFYKDYQNLLQNAPKINYRNGGYGFAYGFDTFVKRSFQKLSGWISYSYLQARRKWFEYTLLTSPDFDITHNLSIVAKYDFSPKFNLGLLYRYATGKPYTAAAGEHNQCRVPDYQKLDLSFSYLHYFSKGKPSVLYFSIANVLNRKNIFDYRYSEDYTQRQAVTSSMNRTVYFGISLSF